VCVHVFYARACVALEVFFFESRGGHTSLVSDWSSDVCSSDLFLVFEIAYELLRPASRDRFVDAEVGKVAARRAQQLVRDPPWPRSEERRVGEEGRAPVGTEA